MKLTNISLAVLVALGLVACGGSDDNKNQTTDPEPPKEIPGGGDDIKPTDPKGDTNNLAPTRKAPDLTVNESYQAIVNSRKRVFIDRGFGDAALGYKDDGTSYQKTLGTDPADIKLASSYSFVGEDDLVTDSVNKVAVVGNAIAGDYSDASVGAIYVGDFTALTNGEANAFVKVSDDTYARVQLVPLVAAAGKNEYTPDSEFEFTAAAKAASPVDTSPKKDKKFSQEDVVFIANVKDKSVPVITLGDYDATKFDVTRGEATLDNIKVFGEEYSASSVGQNLNFGKLNPMKQIQVEDITGSYTISNEKGSTTSNDDKKINRSITLGKIKAYNLPYSIALVTTNVNDKRPLEKNVFKLPTGPFQVRGYETPSLPREGRAHYYGQSFNASVIGDVELIADFAADRTGISGTIFNRKDHTGKDLPTLSLEKIQLTDPDNHKTNLAGEVTGQPSYADAWSVTIFGPEAEEAAGMLYKGGLDKAKQTIDMTNATIKEVYNTQRGKLTNKSNDPDVK